MGRTRDQVTFLLEENAKLREEITRLNQDRVRISVDVSTTRPEFFYEDPYSQSLITSPLTVETTIRFTHRGKGIEFHPESPWTVYDPIPEDWKMQ